MPREQTPTGRDAGVQPPALGRGNAGRDRDRDRDRRRAERELRLALSEARTVAIVACFVILGHVSWFALLAGHRRVGLVAGGLAFAALVALGGRMEPEPAPGPRGEIAKMTEPAFEDFLASVEAEARLLASGRTAASGSPEEADTDGFRRLVAGAIDDLPAFVRVELERDVAVVISDEGASHGAYGYYGLYMGGTVANGGWRHQIVIFRDMLVRDFGSDPEALRRKVTMTLRHEMAHHLGAGERYVAELGLSDLTGPRPAKPCGAGILGGPSRRGSVTRSATSYSFVGWPVRHAPAVATGDDARRPVAAPTPLGFRLGSRPVLIGAPSAGPHRARPPPLAGGCGTAETVAPAAVR